jgi:hypothetical protein
MIRRSRFLFARLASRMLRGGGSGVEGFRVSLSWFPLFIALATLALAGCLTGGSSSTETGDNVNLSGHVLQSGHPAPGVVVTLASAGLSDTTDSQGAYRVKGHYTLAAEPPENLGKKSGWERVIDSLVFTRNGNRVALKKVTRWVDTLSDLQVHP